MIENVAILKKKILDTKEELKAELEHLRDLGYARHFNWSDKYDFYSTWVIYENKELLSKIYIDGWSDDNGYAIECGDDYQHLPRDHPELIRVEI